MSQKPAELFEPPAHCRPRDMPIITDKSAHWAAIKAAGLDRIALDFAAVFGKLDWVDYEPT